MYEYRKCHFIQTFLLLAVQITKKCNRSAYELYLKSKGVAIDETAHKLSLSNTNIWDY